MSGVSRRKLAAHAVTRLMKGDSVTVVMRELAAYLIDTGRTREAELVIRDIETALLSRGIVLVTAHSPRALSAKAKTTIEQLATAHYTDVTRVIIREERDESVIGGVKLVLPDKQLDATVKAKLEKLKG